MTAHLTDPTYVYPFDRDQDRKAFERSATLQRRSVRVRKTYKEARLAYLRDPKAAIRELKDAGHRWRWICEVLGIDFDEAWGHFND